MTAPYRDPELLRPATIDEERRRTAAAAFEFEETPTAARYMEVFCQLRQAIDPGLWELLDELHDLHALREDERVREQLDNLVIGVYTPYRRSKVTEWRTVRRTEVDPLRDQREADFANAAEQFLRAEDVS